MILVDSSAWIDYLRQTESTADRRLLAAIENEEELAVTEPIVMEVLAGARDAQQLRALERLLNTAEMLSVGWLEGWHEGAALFRACRAAGVTVRSLFDCLIASVALREDVSLLTSDRDFTGIARVTGLRLV